MPQPYPTPPRGATGQALWSYLYQLAEQLNAQAAPAAASETAAPNGGSAARIAAEARQTAANALAAVSTAASTVENAATTAENAATAAARAQAPKQTPRPPTPHPPCPPRQDLAEITDALQASLERQGAAESRRVPRQRTASAMPQATATSACPTPPAARRPPPAVLQPPPPPSRPPMIWQVRLPAQRAARTT